MGHLEACAAAAGLAALVTTRLVLSFVPINAQLHQFAERLTLDIQALFSARLNKHVLSLLHSSRDCTLF